MAAGWRIERIATPPPKAMLSPPPSTLTRAMWQWLHDLCGATAAIAASVTPLKGTTTGSSFPGEVMTPRLGTTAPEEEDVTCLKKNSWAKRLIFFADENSLGPEMGRENDAKHSHGMLHYAFISTISAKRDERCGNDSRGGAVPNPVLRHGTLRSGKKKKTSLKFYAWKSSSTHSRPQFCTPDLGSVFESKTKRFETFPHLCVMTGSTLSLHNTRRKRARMPMEIAGLNFTGSEKALLFGNSFLGPRYSSYVPIQTVHSFRFFL